MKLVSGDGCISYLISQFNFTLNIEENSVLEHKSCTMFATLVAFTILLPNYTANYVSQLRDLNIIDLSNKRRRTVVKIFEMIISKIESV